MDIEVDCCVTSEREHYFISVSLNSKEAISFDNTLKGYRVIKQVLIKKESLSNSIKKYGSVVGKWDTIVLKNNKLARIKHNKWIDNGKIDIVNGEIWETIWEKPLNEKINKKLLYYSRLISDNYKKLDQFSNEMKNFEKFIQELVIKFN